MISKEALEDFWNNTRLLKDEGRAAFDIDGVCRWSYFMVDVDKEKLSKIGRYLESEGYEIYGFLEPVPEDDDEEAIYLRFDRIEKHTLETLFERNLELYKLAEQYNLKDYDGVDVGAIDGP